MLDLYYVLDSYLHNGLSVLSYDITVTYFCYFFSFQKLPQILFSFLPHFLVSYIWERERNIFIRSIFYIPVVLLDPSDLVLNFVSLLIILGHLDPEQLVDHIFWVPLSDEQYSFHLKRNKCALYVFISKVVLENDTVHKRLNWVCNLLVFINFKGSGENI